MNQTNQQDLTAVTVFFFFFPTQLGEMMTLMRFYCWGLHEQFEMLLVFFGVCVMPCTCRVRAGYFSAISHEHVTDVIYISLTFTRSAHMFYSKVFTLYGQAMYKPQKKIKKSLLKFCSVFPPVLHAGLIMCSLPVTAASLLLTSCEVRCPYLDQASDNDV